jgi:hypothetical protein
LRYRTAPGCGLVNFRAGKTHNQLHASHQSFLTLRALIQPAQEDGLHVLHASRACLRFRRHLTAFRRSSFRFHTRSEELSSGTLRRVTLVRTDVSEEHLAPIFRVLSENASQQRQRYLHCRAHLLPWRQLTSRCIVRREVHPRREPRGLDVSY